MSVSRDKKLKEDELRLNIHSRFPCLMDGRHERGGKMMMKKKRRKVKLEQDEGKKLSEGIGIER